MKGNEKHIVITNDNDAAPAFVRVKVNSSASVKFSDPDKMWEKQGDWYVYKEAVPAGGQTTELVVKIDFDNEKCGLCYVRENGKSLSPVGMEAEDEEEMMILPACIELLKIERK